MQGEHHFRRIGFGILGGFYLCVVVWVTNNHRGDYLITFCLDCVFIKLNEQIALFYLIARFAMGGEMFAFQIYSINTHMHQQFCTRVVWMFTAWPVSNIMSTSPSAGA